MPFEPFDLGRVIATAESIKGMRRQSEDDLIRRQYLQGQIGLQQQTGQFAAEKHGWERREADVTFEAEEAKRAYIAADQVVRSTTPKALVEQQFPQFIEQLSAQGIDWSTLDDDRVRMMAERIAAKAASDGGILPQKAGTTPSSIQEFEYAQRNPEFREFIQKTGAGNTPSAVQEFNFYNSLPPDKKREFLEVKRSTMVVKDVGGVPSVINPSTQGTTIQPLSSLPQEAAAAGTIEGAKKAATTTAEATAKATADFPRIEQNTTEALSVIKQLKEHPGLPFITGIYSKAPILPNTRQAAADALAQQVQGQTFLQAYQTLKGGGQITEVEGKKAEAAIARLSRAQSTKDYKSALSELETVLKTGLARARKQGNVTQKAESNPDPLGIRK